MKRRDLVVCKVDRYLRAAVFWNEPADRLYIRESAWQIDFFPIFIAQYLSVAVECRRARAPLDAASLAYVQGNVAGKALVLCVG